MDQQGIIRGKLFENKDGKETQLAYVGMDDKDYAAFLRKKELRERAVRDLEEELQPLTQGTSYYVNDSGILQLVHLSSSYQLLFTAGDCAVIYVVNTEMPLEAFREKVAYLNTVLYGSGISVQILTQPIYQNQFRKVDWAMDGALGDLLNKLPYADL